MKMLDCPKNLSSSAAKLKRDGYEVVARYIFRRSKIKDLLMREEAKALHAQGIKIVAIFEDGLPIKATYFTQKQGELDGRDAAILAKAAGQPLIRPVWYAIDYDAVFEEVREYAVAFQKSIKAAGFLCAGCYANGEVCKILKEKGIVSYTWLSQSTGFRGYNAWKPFADICQLPEGSWQGIGVDFGVCGKETAAW